MEDDFKYTGLSAKEINKEINKLENGSSTH